MSGLEEIPTPALLLDADVLDANLEAMGSRAGTLGVRLRPHVKTHKCVEVGQRQLRLGASGITASTLPEAKAFADAGFDDITWAFPLILSRLDQALELASEIRLGLLVDSLDAAKALAAAVAPDRPALVWLKVDCGYHRAGVDPSSSAALDLARAIDTADNLRFAGILTHSGHAYHAGGANERSAVAEQERRVMVEFAGRLREHGIATPQVSVGSTPSMTAARTLDGVTEARPGNYAFFDYTQCVLGSCSPSDCALTVLASVVSSQPDHCVVDAGALAMSQDRGSELAPEPTMGRIYRDYGAGQLDPRMHLTSLSQEHGIVNQPLPIGTRLRILPNHSCLTAACFDTYHVVSGDDLIDTWKICRER